MITRRTFVSGSAALTGMALAPNAGMAQSDYPNQTVPLHLHVPARRGRGCDRHVRVMPNKLSKLTGKSFIVENRAVLSAISPQSMSPAPSPTATLICILRRAVRCWRQRRICSRRSISIRCTTSSISPPCSSFHSCSWWPRQSLQDRRGSHRTSEEAGREGQLWLHCQHGTGVERALQGGYGAFHRGGEDTGAMANDLLRSGQTAFTDIDPISFAAYLKDGRMRALALSSAERSKAMPSIPSTKEAGIPIILSPGGGCCMRPKARPSQSSTNWEGWMNEVVNTRKPMPSEGDRQRFLPQPAIGARPAGEGPQGLGRICEDREDRAAVRRKHQGRLSLAVNGGKP